MKKRIFAAMLAFTVLGSINVFAEEPQQQKLPAIEQKTAEDTIMESQYMTVSGKIESIEKEKDYYIISVTNDDMGMRFTADVGAFIVNSKDGNFMTFDELQNGMDITGIITKNGPMTMSLPPMTSAVGFVTGTENFVATGYFDEELTSQDTLPILQLNISDETKIVDMVGSKKIFTQNDVQNQDCLVVYGATTRSIPAQTSPVFVMILEREEIATEPETDIVAVPEEKEMESQTEQPKGNIEDLPMELPTPKAEPSPEGNFVPLREIAENEGFSVTWTANDKPVILQKEDTTIEITVGQKEYKKNGETLQADREAKLMQSKIYVSENIIK